MLWKGQLDSLLSHGNHLASCQGRVGGEGDLDFVSGDWGHQDTGIASCHFLGIDRPLTVTMAVSRRRRGVKITCVLKAVNSDLSI